MKKIKKYDCIVIGAGNGGLSAALRLATKGYKVLVVEKHNLPGGFASSFVRGRFEWDASLHELCDFGNKQFPGDVMHLFADYKLNNLVDTTTIPDSYRFITFDSNHYDVQMPWGEKKYIDAMEKYVPGSKNVMIKLFALMKEIVDAQNYASSKGGKVESSYMMKHFPNYLRAGSYSVKQVLDAMKVPLKAQQIFGAYWCYLGVSLDEMNFQHYGSMVYRYLTRGIIIFTKTSHQMALAAVERIRELGSDVWLNSQVKRILTKNNDIIGVELIDGKIIESNHIIANISPNKVYSSLIDPSLIPEVAIRNTNARTIGVRGFNVYLGLNKTPKELGIKNYTYLVYDQSDSTKLCKQLENNIDRNPLMIAATCPTVVNKDMSPKGTTLLSITSFFLNNSWCDVTAENYEKEKNRVAKKVIEIFEKATNTNIQSSIEEISVASPMTFARYGGHPQGTIYGYKCGYIDCMASRLQMMEEDNYINGLRFTGGFGPRGDGYSSTWMIGEVCGRQTIKDIEKQKGNK